MTTELNKPKRKRQSAKYFVVANNESVAEFKTHRKAAKYIKEEFNGRDYGLTEADSVKVIKVVEKVIAEYPVQLITLVRASQLDL